MATPYKLISLASNLLLVLALAGMAGSIYVGYRWHNSKSVLDVVLDRGYLRCGINGELPGYNGRSKKAVRRQVAPDVNVDQYEKDLSSGYIEEGSGFEPEFCWVIAIGIFGDDRSRVLFKTLDTKNRFSSLVNKEVDVVIRNTTITSERDTNEKYNLDYGPVIYHDGQKVMVHKGTVNNLEDLADQEICVLKDSTNSGNLQEVFYKRGIRYTPRYENDSGVQFRTPDQALASFLFNECKAITSDETGLLSYKRKAKFEDDFVIIPETPISYEPLAPYVVADDSRWLDMVTYSIYTTILAEQEGVTREKIEKDETIFGAPKTWLNMGIKQDNSAKIIEYLGNYGEIYSRYLGHGDRGRNNITKSGGLLISPPLK